jgi:methanogenic corrinoid protein MtbC1
LGRDQPIHQFVEKVADAKRSCPKRIFAQW